MIYVRTKKEALGDRSVVAVTSAPKLSISEAIPVPKGTPSKAFFVVGAIGCIINTIAAIWFSFLALIPIFGYPFPRIMGYVLLVIGLILASTGYFGMRRNYDSGVGTASFALGVATGILFLLFTIWEIMLYLLGAYPIFGYELNLYVLFTIYDIFFVLIILWGITNITTRHFTGKSGLSMATGIILILTAVFLQIWNTVWFVGITVWGYMGYYWFWDMLELTWTLLFFVSEILATILFLMAKVPQLPAKPTS